MSKRYRNSSDESSSSSEEKKSKKKSKQEVKEDVKKLHESSTGRTGGVYIPPFKMRLIEKSIKDKVSQEYQRVTWDALKKSLNGIVNKVYICMLLPLLTIVGQSEKYFQNYPRNF
jgi:pre-mRNA-splicing factor CWC22